jgi:hypothetical protein
MGIGLMKLTRTHHIITAARISAPATMHETFHIIEPYLAEHGISLEVAAIQKVILSDFLEWNTCIWNTNIGRGILWSRGTRMGAGYDGIGIEVNLCEPDSLSRLVKFLREDPDKEDPWVPYMTWERSRNHQIIE